MRRLSPGTLWAVFTAVAVLAGLGAVGVVRAALTGSSPAAMSQAEVVSALAEATGAPVPGAPDAGPGTPDARPTSTRRASQSPSSQPSTPAGAGTTPPPAPVRTSQPSRSGGTGGQSSPPARTVSRTFATKGGTVVASCTGSSVYLKSWSPASGYRVGEVHRGPAGEAEAKFEAVGGGSGEVSIHVTCRAGAPVAQVESDTGAASDA